MASFDICAIMIVKNEEDILPFVLKNTLDQVAKVFIINNNSSDATADVIHSFNDGIEYYENNKEPYDHSLWMTRLANMAIYKGFRWIVPIDGDEMWRNISVLSSMESYDLVRVVEIRNHLFFNYSDKFHPDKMPFYRVKNISGSPRICFKSPFQKQVDISDGSHGFNILGQNRYKKINTTNIIVDHYPFRNESQYWNKVYEGTKAVMATAKNPKIACHWRRIYNSPHKFQSMTGHLRCTKLL